MPNHWEHQDRECHTLMPVRFHYYEFADSYHALKSVEDWETRLLTGLRWCESYPYQMKMNAFAYLVGGEKKSNLHDTLECEYYDALTKAFEENRSANRKMQMIDMTNLGRLAACLGMNAFIKDHYADKSFVVRGLPMFSKECARTMLKRETQENFENVTQNQQRVINPEKLVLRTKVLQNHSAKTNGQEEFSHYFRNENKVILLHVGPGTF